MASKRIKTDWASIRIIPGKEVLVYSHFQGKPKFLNYDDIESFQESLKRKQLSVNRWILSIPNNICISKTLDLPTNTLSEAAQMVEFELMSLVPIKPKDFVYGCTILKQQKHLLEVLVYIVRNDLLDQILEPYHKIGVYPRTIIPDSVALYSCLENIDPISPILLYIDKAQCHIFSSIKNNLRTYNRLDKIDIHDDSCIEHLANSIINLTDESKAFSDNTSITLVSKDEYKKNWPLLLKAKGVKSLITIKKQAEFLPENTLSSLYEKLLIKGAFNSINDHRYEHLNLLPSKNLNQIKRKQKIKNILLTGSLSILVLFLLWANFVLSNWRIIRTCRKVQGQIAPIEHIAKDVEHKKQLVRALQNQLSTGHEITRTFQDFYQFSPKAITISNLQYKFKTDYSHITIKGQTDSLSQALDYSEPIKESKLLKRMQITNVQQTPTPGGSIVEFKAECLLQDK